MNVEMSNSIWGGGGMKNKVLRIFLVFLENNYKIQTISLVRKRFKLIWFLTIRVQRTRFLGYKIEYIVLEFPVLPAARLST